MKFLFQFFLIISTGVFFSCASKNTHEHSEVLPFAPDSIRITALFSAALGAPNAVGYIDSAKVVVQQSKNPRLCNDLYLAQLATFQLKRGEFENAMKTAEKGIQFHEDSLSKNRAKFYNIQGHVYSFTKNNTAAIASFKKALALFEKAQDSLNVAYINNNIANIFFSLTDYATAYKHSKASYNIIQHHPENPYYGSILSVLAISEAFINETKAAKEHATQALKLTENTPNIVPYAISLYALGDIAVSEDSLLLARQYYTQSLQICESYQILPYALINKTALLNVCVKEKKFEEGIEFGKAALSLSEQTQNENIQLSIHKNLAKAYRGIGQNATAFDQLEKAYSLKEEVSSKENKSIIHDLLIQYESEKKDKEISNNRIKLLEDEATINRGRFYIALLVIGFIIVGVVVVFYLKSRKEQLLRIEKEKETEVIKANLNGEQRERLRLSRELHDGIASELLGIRLKGQESNINSEWLSALDQMHQEVRRISHNLAPFKIEQFGLVEALKIFCIENSTSKATVHFFSSGNTTVSSDNAQIIYRCAQELIQNALKHAKAKDIDVQLFLDNKIRLSVEDDGIGMDNNMLDELIKKIKAQWGPSKILADVSGDSTSGSGSLFTIEFNS